jgi:VIT1/CCC1 family predicted Fe2+/Mn2+ transporter
MTRYLDPEVIFAEILFGLIMALTFTLGATMVARLAGGEPLQDIVFGAVTCNLAWGMIDAVLYILGEVFALGTRAMQIKQVQRARTKEDAMRRLHEIFDDRIGTASTPEERDHLYAEVHALVMRMEAPKKRPTLDGLIGAFIVFVLVSATSLPVLLPALLLPDIATAVQVGNFLLVACLFLTGFGMARAVGDPGMRYGLAMAMLGLILVGIAKALGG